MKLYKKIFLLILAVISIVWYFVTNFYFNSTKNNNLTSLPVNVQPKEYMKNFTIQNFTKDGDFKNIIQGSWWDNSYNSVYSKVKNPYIKIFKQDGTIWKITADNATLWHDNAKISNIKKVHLINNVIIQRLHMHDIDIDNQNLQLTTSDLNYLPDEQKIITDQFVRITQTNLEITGTGMTSYLKNSTMELHSNVKTKYNPSNSANTFSRQ